MTPSKSSRPEPPAAIERTRMALAEAGYPHVPVEWDDECGVLVTTHKNSVRTAPPEILWKALHLALPGEMPCRSCWVSAALRLEPCRCRFPGTIDCEVTTR